MHIGEKEEECRQARGVTFLESVAQDVRYAIRALLKSPVFAATAVVTLTLGVAATTVVFSVVDSILLNPIPFKEPDRLVEIYRYGRTGGGPMQPAAMLPRWREQTQIFEQVEAHWEVSFALTGGAEPEVIYGSQVTVDLFRFLGVQAQMGRVFASDESDSRLALISEELWNRRFASDPKIIGRTLRLNDDVFTIIGVMPSWFRFPVTSVHIWIPFDPLRPNPHSPRAGLTPIARLRQGVPLEQADAQAAALAPRLDATLSGPARPTARLRPMNPYAPNSFLFHLRNLQRTRTVLFLMLGAAALVLLASCANSANLFLSRALSRGREIAVRAAIGGSRLRLARYILTESLIISAIAASFGLMLAWWVLRGIGAIVPENLLERSLRSLDLDGRAALWAVLTSVLAGLIAATVPAIGAVRGDLTSALRGRSETRSRSNIRFRGLLIVVESTLALLLLIGGGLMARSLWKLMHVDTGWSAEGFTVIQPQFRGSRYSTPASREDLMMRLSAQFRAIPGVEETAFAEAIPLLPTGFSWGVLESDSVAIDEAYVTMNRVSPGYFKTLGIPFSLGRSFDDADGPQSAIITREMAEKLWPAGDPLGKRFQLRKEFDWLTVVGVVSDIQSFAFDSQINAYEVYQPLRAASTPSRMRYLAVKADQRANVLKALRDQSRQLDPDLPVDIRSIDDIYRGTLTQPVFQATLLGGFALLTVLLAVAGVYAVVAYEASQRTQEIGIRVALGATRGAVTRQVMRGTLFPASLGVIAGLIASLLLTRLMSSMLYGIQPTDPVTFAVGVLLLLGAVSVAGFLPARRAARVDPVVALRNE